MRKMYLIRICIIIMLLLLPFLNIACANDKRSPGNKDSIKQPIDFRITWKVYSGRGEAIQKIVDLYNEESRDNYKITVVSGDEDSAALDSLFKSHDTGTIYVLPYRYVQYFGEQGYLDDLSANFAADKQIFYPELWKLAQIKNQTFGIPWLGHSICLIYNKNLLNQAGVDASSIRSLASFAEALAAVEARTQAKGVGLVGANHNDVSWMVNQFIYGYGSSLVDETGTSVTINNQNSREALHFYKDVLGSHAQPGWVDDTGIEVMECFRKQQIAFEFQGPWGVSDIAQNGNPFEIGVIDLDDIGLYAEVGPMMLSIPKSMSSGKKTAAIKFIHFLISKKAQEKIMDGEYSPEHENYYPFRVPVRKDLADSLVFKKYPEYIPFLEGFKHPSIDVPVPGWELIKEQYYAPGLHQVMKSELSIDDFLAMIETKGNDALNTTQKGVK